MRKLIALALLIASVSASAVPQGYEVTNDQFEPVITIVSPNTVATGGDGTKYTILIRSYIDKATKAVSHQLYISANYVDTGWRFYDSAYDDRANSRKFTEINRSVGSCYDLCSHYEDFGIDLSDSEVSDGANAGFSFKLKSKSGFSEIISITPAFFAGQLNALNSYVAKPYALDPTKIPPADPGLELWNMGGVNKRLYKGVDHELNVSGVTAGSPAALAGIRKGDVLLDLDEHRLDRMEDYKAALSTFHGGQTIKAAVRRGKETLELNLGL